MAEADAQNEGPSGAEEKDEDGQPLVDVMGEDSFPASDPPSVWAWDRPPVEDTDPVVPSRPADEGP